MTRMIRARNVVGTLAVGLVLAAPARGQDTLQHVRDLYAAAAYEDALGTLSRIQGAEQRLEIERYRVYCLIALDRPAEAEKAILGILNQDPLYTPDDAAPRVVDLFRRVKRQSAPQIARTLYTDGKAAMGRKDHALAVRKFEMLVRFTEDPDMPADLMMSELRLLAGGYLDLARASLPPAPTATTGTNASASTVPAAGAVVTPPVPLKQDLPRWVPYDAATKQAEYRGAVKVTITAEGKVQSAEIVTPTDRQYDRQLLNAARGWLYEPAKRNGVPISSEKIVSVYLRPK